MKKAEVSVTMVIYHKLGSKTGKTFYSIDELNNWLWDLGYTNPCTPKYNEFDEPKWKYVEEIDSYVATTYAPFIWHGGFMAYIEYILETKRV